MKRIARFVAINLLCLLVPASLVLGQQVSLTLLHTNDTHGHLLPFSYPAPPPGPESVRLREFRNIGGIARRATLIKRLRAELEPRGTTVWVIDAGDILDGTPFTPEYKGEADVAAMNAAGYDFFTLGNHEFNVPLATLKKLISLFRFPILCANAVEVSTGKPLVQTSLVKEVGPLKIGIFGLLIKDAARYQAGKEGVTVADEIETAQKMVAALRPNAGIVIAISHAGAMLDERIAAAVPGLDVIIGGHSHTRLPMGQFIWRSDELKPQEVNGTILVQAYQWGGELGRLDLLLSKDDRSAWHVDRYRARLIPITSDIPEDEAVAAIVDRYWKPIAGRYAEVIGQAEDDFIERGDDFANYNLVADLIREAMGTDIEFENTGGVRAPLAKGNITYEDLLNVDPFDNTVITFKVTGLQLKEILLKSRPAVSGLRYRWDKGQITELTVGGKPVEDTKVYAAASNSYFAGVALKGIEFTDTGKLRRDVLKEQIRKKGTVKPVYDGRRVVVAQERPRN